MIDPSKVMKVYKKSRAGDFLAIEFPQAESLNACVGPSGELVVSDLASGDKIHIFADGEWSRVECAAEPEP